MYSADTPKVAPIRATSPPISTSTPTVATSASTPVKQVIVAMPIIRRFEDRVDVPMHDLKVEFFRHYHYESNPPEVHVTTTEEEAKRLISTDKDGKPLYEGAHLVQ